MSEQNDDAIVAEPVVRPKRKRQSQSKRKPQRQPRYQVILWNDDDHSYDYVVRMMQELFRYPPEQGQVIAHSVDTQGKATCLTTTLEHAELKRDQIHAYGKDKLIERCQGSMAASIEPLE